jgi:predicted dehydrogenase
MVRIALIGCGEHSEIGHALPLARFKAQHREDVELAAVCDLRLERARYFCERYGFQRFYSDIDRMLSEASFDACIAVVPVPAIAQLGIKLLQRYITCVTEKPLGSSLSEITALRDASRSSSAQNMVSVNRRFMPLLNRGLEWMKGAGKPRYIRALMTRHARTETQFLWETGVHAIDTMRYIGGVVTSAQIHEIPGAPSRWYGIDLEFQSGAIGRVDVLPTSGVLEETYELIGDGFRVVVTSPFGPARGLRCYQENSLALQLTDQDMSEDEVFGFYDEAAALIHALKNGDQLQPTIQDIYPSVALCLELAQRVDAPV